MTKIIDPDVMQKMHVLFDAGTGIRATAREIGISRETVAKYYHQRGPTSCPCGKPMTHNGWCSFRVARSTGRQKFLARHVTLKPDTERKWLAVTNLQAAKVRFNEVLVRLQAAWTRQAVIRENELLGAEHLLSVARAAVVRRCVPMILDDVIQDILVELLCGTLEADGLSGSPAISRIINKNYRLLLPASNISIDYPFDQSGRSLADTLSTDTPLFNEAPVTKY